MTTSTKKKAIDFTERVSATFAQAFLAVALVTGVNDTTALKAAGAAGALAAGKFAYVRVNEYLAKPEGPVV